LKNIALARVPRVGVALLVVLVVAGTGCVGPTPTPNAEQAVGDATGLTDAVLFVNEGDLEAARVTETGELSLQEAIRRAVLQSARLQERLARVRIALADAEQARLLPNPVLDLVYRFPRTSGAPDEIEVGVSAQLVPLLTRPGRSRSADDTLRAAVSDAVNEAIDVVFEVRRNYETARAFDEFIAAVEGRRDLLGRLVTVAQERLDSGEGTRIDVTSLRAQQADLELDVLDFARERQDARLELAHLIGEPESSANWTLESRQPLAPLNGDDQRWIEAALVKRPDLEALRWEIEALKEDAKLAGVSILEGAGAGVSAEKAEDWSIGPALSVPIPIFDFGAVRRARAEAVLLAAQHRFTDQKRLAISEVRRAHATCLALQTALARLRGTVLPLQQQRQTEIEGVYRSGQADITTLILAEQELRLAQVRLVDLEQKAAHARTALERAVGGPAAATRVETELHGSEPGDRP
jgi:outer membrane protein TolC